MLYWFSLSGDNKYPWVVSVDKKYQTNIFGVKFHHKYFSLSLSGLLVIRKGYMWNGNTGVPLWFEKLNMRMVGASAIHDALYQAIQLKLLPKSYRNAADRELKNKWVSDGFNLRLASFGYNIVTIFGRFKV